MIGGNDWEYRERKMWQLRKDAPMEIQSALAWLYRSFGAV